MRHPAFTERVLDGLIVDRSMSEALLGDLAEEWSERVDRVGLHAANLWYCLQALRSLPTLLVEWIRKTGLLVVFGTLGLGVGIRVVTAVLGALTMAVTAEYSALLGMDRWAVTGVSSLGPAACAFAAGWLVARFSRRAPVPAILWLTLMVYTTNISVSGPMDDGLIHGWYGLLEKLITIAAAMAGGMFAMRGARRAAVTSRAS